MSNTQPTLTTARLVLRPFVLTDASRVQELAGVREVADTTLYIPHPYPDGAAEEWIATHAELWRDGSEAVYAITLRESGDVIGAIALRVDAAASSGEMGYWIGVPYWNRGYCTEAATVLLTFAFETLQLQRAVGRHFTRNVASGRVMQKLGMQFVEMQPAALHCRGQWEDATVYLLEQRFWRGRNSNH
jgi:[ribosomal protein S5]-alanine N-acetyltransferase